MADKPTEIVEWAEDAAALTDEPVGERARGWPFSYIPPADQKNWLQRAVGRWIAWLQFFVANQIHDGGSTDLSAPKVDFTDHIDYGENGLLRVSSDEESEYTIALEPTDAAPVLLSIDGGMVATSRLEGSQVDLTGTIAPSKAYTTLNRTNTTKAVARVRFDYDDTEPGNWAYTFEYNVGFSTDVDISIGVLLFEVLGASTAAGDEWDIEVLQVDVSSPSEDLISRHDIAGPEKQNIEVNPRRFTATNEFESFVLNGGPGDTFTVHLVTL